MNIIFIKSKGISNQKVFINDDDNAYDYVDDG
jgi:hypothetical protein